MRVIRIFTIVLALVSSSPVFAQGPPPAQVVVAMVGQEEIAENRSFLGVLFYDRKSHVSSEVSGLIKKVEVREGDRVKKGDPLLSLDTEILDKDILLSRTRVEQIDLRIQQAGKNFERRKNIFTKDGISEKDYEDARYTWQDYVKEKQAAEIVLAILQIRKNKSIITAPFDGVILNKNVDSGDWVQQGKELFTLGAADGLVVRVPISETVLQFVTQGEKVSVVITAFDKELTGTIDDFDPTADEKTKNVFLKVRIPHQTKVAENMSASVFVPTSPKRKLAIIPRDALIKFQGKDFVYTVKEDKAAILPVNIVTYLGNRIGADNPYFVAGMPVVVEGNERLRPDQPVVISGEN